MAIILPAIGMVSAQSYYDDDIYYDASKAKKQQPAKVVDNNYRQSQVADYPAADTYSYSVNGTRSISVDDYNRRGIFAADTVSADSTASDFQYTRRIEKYYNPEVVTAQNDPELANIYYMEPDQVNIYVNTPSGYWGYDYLSPYAMWNLSFGYPYYNNYWRWSSPWYWNTWYDPYWSWSWGWGAGWAPKWGPGWGPSWSWGWGPGWGYGWSRPRSPRHPGGWSGSGAHRPGNVPSSGVRPGFGTGNRHQGSTMRPGTTNGNYRPGNNSGVRPGNNTGVRPGNNGGTYRPGNNSGSGRPSNNNGYNRPSNNNNNYNRPSNTNGGRTPSYNSGGGSRGGFGGGGRSSGGGRSAGGRGRH